MISPRLMNPPSLNSRHLTAASISATTVTDLIASIVPTASNLSATACTFTRLTSTGIGGIDILPPPDFPPQPAMTASAATAMMTPNNLVYRFNICLVSDERMSWCRARRPLLVRPRRQLPELGGRLGAPHERLRVALLRAGEIRAEPHQLERRRPAVLKFDDPDAHLFLRRVDAVAGRLEPVLVVGERPVIRTDLIGERTAGVDVALLRDR